MKSLNTVKVIEICDLCSMRDETGNAKRFWLKTQKKPIRMPTCRLQNRIKIFMGKEFVRF